MLTSAKVHDEVVAGLVEQAQGLVLGDTRSADTTLGPLNSARQRERVEGFIERRPQYAEVATGGREPGGPGFFLEPTVAAGLRQDDEMIQREIFGPVITVQQFSNEEEAIAWANGTPYGLAFRCGHVTPRGRCASRTRCGSAPWINDHIPLVSEMPHGGFKQSGYEGPQHICAGGIHRGKARDGVLGVANVVVADATEKTRNNGPNYTLE